MDICIIDCIASFGLYNRLHRPPSDLNAPPGAHLHLRLEPRDLLLQLPDEVGLVHPVALHRGADLLHHVREAQGADRLLQIRPRRTHGGDHTGAAVTAQAVRQQERESRVAEGEVLAIEALRKHPRCGKTRHFEAFRGQSEAESGEISIDFY